MQNERLNFVVVFNGRIERCLSFLGGTPKFKNFHPGISRANVITSGKSLNNGAENI